jgi:hypothetical protein
LCKIGVGILDEAPDDEHNQEEQHGHQQPVLVFLRDVDVDRYFGEVRTYRFHGAGEHAQDDTKDNMPPVWPQILQEPTHQPGIVCFAEDFFFVHGSMKN